MIFLATGFAPLSRGLYDPAREAAGCSVTEHTGHPPRVSKRYVIAGWHLGSTLVTGALYRPDIHTSTSRARGLGLGAEPQPLRSVRSNPQAPFNLGTSGRPRWRKWSERSANRSRATRGHGCANASGERVTIPES